MRPPEWIALAYFAYVVAAALAGPFRTGRGRVATLGVLLIAGIVLLGRLDGPLFARIRDWAPGLYVVFGYWLPGRLVERHHLPFENWLRRRDAPVLPLIDTLMRRAPRVLLEYLELAYLCCYPLVPLAFAWLAVHGRVADADRYWTVVLLAVYPCYGLVPWLATNPPRALEASAIDARTVTFRAINLSVLSGVSIQVNTFPSGHTAGALAAAAVVGEVMPLSGAVLVVLAISIAVGSVVGRYHYAADAVSGALVALLAWGCGEWWLPPAP